MSKVLGNDPVAVGALGCGGVGAGSPELGLDDGHLLELGFFAVAVGVEGLEVGYVVGAADRVGDDVVNFVG